MPKLSTAIDPKSETFLANAAVNRALNDELRSPRRRRCAGRTGSVTGAP